MSSSSVLRVVTLCVAIVGCSDAPTSVAVVLERDIIFHQDVAGNTDIYAVNADGSGLLRLTTTAGDDRFPSVSPDGSTIVFVSARDATTFANELYLMDADGSNVRRLTFDSSTVAFPEFSPDGSRVAYQLLQPGGDFDVMTVRLDGSDRRNISGFSGGDYYASWSPDGQRIAFSSGRVPMEPFGDQLDLYVAAHDGTGLVRVTQTVHSEYAPAFSPDGSRLAFHAKLTTYDDIFTVAPDGTGLARLTNTAGFDGYARWSPDGRRLVYDSRPGGDCCRLMTMAADGTDARLVLQLASAPYPKWIPRR